LCCV